MIIKHPKEENIPGLTHLWAEAFGDTAEFIKGFFCTGYSPERCLLAEEAGETLGALYWFDCLWEGKRIAYLYAIATGKAYRGRGICRRLMEETHRHLANNGYAGAILMPADEGLARMYGKLGYRQLDTPAEPGENWKKPTFCDPITPGEYLRRRGELLPRGGVQHTLPAMTYFSTFGGFYRFPEGIFCGTPEAPAEWLPGGIGVAAMYLPFGEDPALPNWFSLSLA